MEAICIKCQILFSDLHELSNPVFWKYKHSFFKRKRVLRFIQIVSNGDNLHEMSNPVFCKKNKKTVSVCCLLNLPREW